MKRYGIFGGSFNPPHIGHSILAENVREQLSLDKVIFMVSGSHPLKDDISIQSAEHRLKMSKLAFGEDAHFEVSDLEIKKAKNGVKNFTVDTMIDLYNLYKDDIVKLYLIIGIDNLIDFPKWKTPEKLFIISEVIVMNRPGFFIQDVSLEFSRKARYLSVPMLEISSTDIRQRISENKTVKYLLKPEVEDYVIKNKLYK